MSNFIAKKGFSVGVRISAVYNYLGMYQYKERTPSETICEFLMNRSETYALRGKKTYNKRRR